MKKRKMVKKAAIIALSSVLAAGSLTALAGCGGGNSATTLSVSIFCNETDAEVNLEIMERWAKEYSESHNLGFEINVKDGFTPYTNKKTYFQDITNYAANGQMSDVVYLAPKYVRQWSKLGYVMDLSQYLPVEYKKATNEVWNNAISYYGYDTTDNNYVLGQSIKYDETSDKFVRASDSTKEVGIYGLPKDYSNFSLGYNKQFFTQKLVEEYQTRKATDARSVANPTAARNSLFNSDVTPVATYSAARSPIATFAVSGTYNIYNADGTVAGTAEAVAGQEAPMLAFGVPVNYKPYNFYLYNDYQSALDNGDPIACLVQGLAGSNGFTVTIPGLPGWTFDIDEATGYTDHNSDAYKHAVNEDAAYDSSIGHITFTYQEYGALSWALSYYLNTFAWEDSNPLNGNGGRRAEEGTDVLYYGIYGGEQYEYTDGCVMYLLPWLAANDVDFVNEMSTTAINPTGPKSEADMAARENDNVSSYAGTTTELRHKTNLDGTTRDANVQYGMNSQEFLKVYAAYANHGALWNANAGAAKDGKGDDGNSGWNYFQQGRSIFYGAGSWDAATRNDADPTQFDFGQMPTPVAEDYALYSRTTDADYTRTLVTYANKNNEKGTGANALSVDKEQGNVPTKPFLAADIYRNQILRQDKWAGRMDSVGYAANARLATLAEDDPEYWKKEAATSLIAALTVEKLEQITLTYAGAQLPNFVQQCEDFLNYQKSDYANGSFKDMLTPDGFADNTPYGTGADVGRKIWDYYYKVVVAMANDSKNSSKNGQTVSEWVASCGYGDYKEGSETGDPTKPLRYNAEFADLRLADFKGVSGNNYFNAMKVLNMANFSYADRDLNIRMQSGLNAVRDSTMYTPDDQWLMGLNAANYSSSSMLTYYTTMALNGKKASVATDLKMGRETAIGRTYKTANPDNEGSAEFWSPAYFATTMSFACELSLQNYIAEENRYMGNN